MTARLHAAEGHVVHERGGGEVGPVAVPGEEVVRQEAHTWLGLGLGFGFGFGLGFRVRVRVRVRVMVGLGLMLG